MAETSTERFAVIKSLEAGTKRLQPGETVRIGRHHENDLVLRDAVISRFHATIRWDKGAERPVLYDNGSQNGSVVDGREVHGGAVPLEARTRITIGPYVLNVEVHGLPGQAALLDDAPDAVALFTEQGPDLEGRVETKDALRQLVLRLEVERRSGTLTLERPGLEPAVLTLGAGRIMAAHCDGAIALRALEAISKTERGSYRFSRELEPSDQAMNLWFSDYLRMKHDSYYTTRQWKRPPSDPNQPAL